MLNPILFGGPTEKLRSILDDDWIVGSLGHDLAYILVDEMEIIEDDLNNDTKYRKAFVETKDNDRVQVFGSICTIPVYTKEKIEIGVVRFDEESWGLEAYTIVPEEDFVDEKLEFNPSEEEWEELFDHTSRAGLPTKEVRQKVLSLVQEINSNPEAKKQFVERFNQTLSRYPVDCGLPYLSRYPVTWEFSGASTDGSYSLKVKFVKTSDNRWSIKPYMSVSMDRMLEMSEEEINEL